MTGGYHERRKKSRIERAACAIFNKRRALKGQPKERWEDQIYAVRDFWMRVAAAALEAV